MGDNLVVYYLPVNTRVVKGKSYALYMNNNTNLDLSAIKDSVVESKLVLEREDFVKLDVFGKKMLVYVEEEKKRLLELNGVVNECLGIIGKVGRER